MCLRNKQGKKNKEKKYKGNNLSPLPNIFSFVHINANGNPNKGDECCNDKN